MRKFLASILILGLLIPSFPRDVFAANTLVRQEINITDAYAYSPSGSYATSSPIISLDPVNYSSPTAYLEVVASTTSATDGTISLVNATSGVPLISVTANGTSYARYRSVSFSLQTGPTEYKVKLGNEAVGKGIIASRVIVLQNAASLINTETQIEIGNEETYTSVSTTTFVSPKYWNYDQTKWDVTQTFYAEVTYARTVDATISTASSTSYLSSGTFTVVIPAGVASTSIQLWAGGGGAGAASTNNSGSGSGGAGGQAAKKTIASLGGLTKTLVVGAFGPGGVSTAAGTAGGDSTWDTNVAVAKGGAPGAANSGTAGAGSTTGCVGDASKCFAGGNGAAGTASGVSGGGGEGAGSTATGGNASNGTGGSGTDGGDGGTGQTGNGTPAAASNPGGGGAGGRSTGTPNADGGAGGVGRAIITNDIISAANATTTIALQESDGTGDGFQNFTDKVTLVRAGDSMATTPTRVRSSAFTPTHGRNYRIAFKSGYTGATFAIYNAKIVVDQVGALTLEDSNTANQGASGTVFGNDVTAWAGNGTSFTTTSAYSLSDVDFYLEKSGSPADNVYVELSTTVNGAAVATSDNVAGSSITGSYVYTRFHFGTPVALSNATVYYLRGRRTGALDASNFYIMGEDNAASYAGGDPIRLTDGTWTKFTGSNDPNFKTYAQFTVTKLQPQYLMADFPLAAGTALQKFLTSWLSTEWSTTNGYVLQGEAANGSASVVELDTAAGVQIPNSVISTIDNRATSTLMCMPANGDLDIKATTNGGDIYAVRILVDVGTSATPSCVSPPASSLIFRAGFKIKAPFIKR